MTIIGFNFSKMLAQQKKAAKGNLKIGTNVKIDGLEKTSLVFDKERMALKLNFTYNVRYDPDIGGVELQGDILFLQEKKVAEGLLAEWEKKKALPKKVSSGLVNAIMQKCVVQALILTKDIGLPSPLPLPKVKEMTKVQVAEEATGNVKADPKKK